MRCLFCIRRTLNGQSGVVPRRAWPRNGDVDPEARGESELPQVQAPGLNQADNRLQHDNLHDVSVAILPEEVGHAGERSVIDVGVSDLRYFEIPEAVSDLTPAYANVNAAELLLSLSLHIIDQAVQIVLKF